MTSEYLLVKILLAVLITVTALSFLISTISMAGTGAFHADYFYLPMREYVEQDQQRAMEEKVIELWNAQQFRKGILAFTRDAVCLVCLFAVRFRLFRIESKDAVHDLKLS